MTYLVNLDEETSLVRDFLKTRPLDVKNNFGIFFNFQRRAAVRTDVEDPYAWQSGVLWLCGYLEQCEGCDN